MISADCVPSLKAGTHRDGTAGAGQQNAPGEAQAVEARL